MGQLARGVEWPADESGVSLCALSLDEAARLLDGVDSSGGPSDARKNDAPISFASIRFESSAFESRTFEADGGSFQPGSFEPGSFEVAPVGTLSFDDTFLRASDEDADPPTQRCPHWDPIASTPSAPADDSGAIDDTTTGAPPFVRSLLTAW